MNDKTSIDWPTITRIASRKNVTKEALGNVPRKIQLNCEFPSFRVQWHSPSRSKLLIILLRIRTNPTVDGLDTEPYRRKSSDPKVSPGAKKIGSIVRNTLVSFQTICFDAVILYRTTRFFVLCTPSFGVSLRCKHVQTRWPSDSTG